MILFGRIEENLRSEHRRGPLRSFSSVCSYYGQCTVEATAAVTCSDPEGTAKPAEGGLLTPNPVLSLAAPAYRGQQCPGGCPQQHHRPREGWRVP